MIEFILYIIAGIVAAAHLVKVARSNDKLKEVTVRDAAFLFVVVFIWPVTTLVWAWMSVADKVLFKAKPD